MSRFFRLALCLLMQVFTFAPANAQQTSDIRAEWNKPSAPFRIIGNIYYVGVRGLGVYLITTPKGHILIDGGLPESVPLIASNIRSLGFRVSDVKILLNSHAHFDHAGGLAGLKRLSGARLVAAEQDRSTLETGRINFGPSANTAFPPVKVDQRIRDGEMLSLGGVSVTAYLTPGHTPGCTTWTMHLMEKGVRHDAVFYCSTTVAGNPLVNNRAYPRIVTDYRETFSKLKRLKADVFLANHPDFADIWGKRAKLGAGPNNPFVNPFELQTFVAASERSFEREYVDQQAKARVHP